MKDQYGRKMPSDLVVLPSTLILDCTPEQLKMIEGIDWYCVGMSMQPILVSRKALNQATDNLLFDAYPPEDFGINKHEQINIIDSCLKRYNIKDGFYHA